MNIKKYILSLFVGLFIFATVTEVSNFVVSYSIYYFEYNDAKASCYNEKPDMYQSGQLFLKALIKRVNDICPNSKPKPPIVESNNMLLYINSITLKDKKETQIKLKNRFVYTFSYDFLNNKDFFHPPLLEA